MIKIIPTIAFVQISIFLCSSQLFSREDNSFNKLNNGIVINSVGVEKQKNRYQKSVLAESYFIKEYQQALLVNSELSLSTEDISKSDKLNYSKTENSLNSGYFQVIAGNIYFILFFLGILIFIILFSFHKRRKKSLLKIDTEQSENSKLVSELNAKNKELISKSIQLSQQNELIENIQLEVKDLTLSSENEFKLKKILSSIKTLKSASNWAEFELYFNEIHTGFYEKLNINYPFLSANERRLCGLLHLNLSSKEISYITGKSVRSIEVARYRLRKRMQLEKDQNLIAVLTNFSQKDVYGIFIVLVWVLFDK